MKNHKKSNLNTNTQEYKGIPLRLITRNYKHEQKAKRFTVNGTNQNIWIPNKHLTDNGTIIATENIDYIFKKSVRKLEIAKIEQNLIKQFQ